MPKNTETQSVALHDRWWLLSFGTSHSILLDIPDDVGDFDTVLVRWATAKLKPLLRLGLSTPSIKRIRIHRVLVVRIAGRMLERPFRAPHLAQR